MLVFNETEKFRKLLLQFKKEMSLIELTLADFYSLSDSVTEADINSKSVFGVKDSFILTSAMSHRLDKYCPIKNQNLLYKDVLRVKDEFAPPFTQNNLNTYYIDIYLSKDKVYIYELDNFARVLSSHVILGNDIENITDLKDYITIKAKKTSHGNQSCCFNITKHNQDVKKVITLENALNQYLKS